MKIYSHICRNARVYLQKYNAQFINRKTSYNINRKNRKMSYNRVDKKKDCDIIFFVAEKATRC